MSIRKSGLSKGQKAILKLLEDGRTTGQRENITLEEAYLTIGANWPGHWRNYTALRMQQLQDRGFVVKHPFGWALPGWDKNTDAYDKQTSLF